MKEKNDKLNAKFSEDNLKNHKCGCGDDNCCKDESVKNNNQTNHKTSHKEKDCGCSDCEENKNTTDEQLAEDINEETLYYLELSQRLKADFDNYKKRNKDISTLSYNNGLASAVESILPVIDTISRAKSNITDEATLKGFDMINAQFIKSLETIGVTKIECLGKKFDPNFHNAVMVDNNTELQDEVILEELQQGFMLKDKVLRHSVVKINKLS